MPLNKVQQVAKELIASDAKFIQTLFFMDKNENKKFNNYIIMFFPYLGIFVDGAEQWAKKVGMPAQSFTNEEKVYYETMRLGMKIFENDYETLKVKLGSKLTESDNYFKSISNFWDWLRGYHYNVGTDLYKGIYCGNTILCSVYTPFYKIANKDGEKIKKLGEVAGKLTVDFNKNVEIMNHQELSILRYKDYNYNKSNFIKVNNFYGFILFCILCSINYVIVFIENFFIDEVPQKLKYAYLNYYYLCNFIEELNLKLKLHIIIDKSMYNTGFRNCLAHYGLGQFLKESEIINDDLLKGLTQKAFNLDYNNTKERIYIILKNVVAQIENIIF